MRLVFLGTPGFAVPTLEAIARAGHEVCTVVSQPDRPSGRGQVTVASPVKQVALKLGIPVFQPERIRGAEAMSHLADLGADAMVVVGYGQIIPQSVIDLAPHGILNVHASLLPKYRGAAPIQWALLRGETTTGVTIMYMNERMDEGEMLLQRATAIEPGETYGALQQRLAVLGAAALMDALAALHAGTLRATPQDHAAATYAPMIRKADGAIDWTQPAQAIADKVRAFNPWPSAHTTLGPRLLKIHRARALDDTAGAAPGTILALGDMMRVATGTCVLGIEELQLEGKRALPADAFARGGGIAVGDRLGAA
jgi:methionyl-tRNA formyltransferase